MLENDVLSASPSVYICIHIINDIYIHIRNNISIYTYQK